MPQKYPKTLSRCKLNKPSFHHEWTIYLTSNPAEKAGAHSGSLRIDCFDFGESLVMHPDKPRAGLVGKIVYIKKLVDILIFY